MEGRTFNVPTLLLSFPSPLHRMICIGILDSSGVRGPAFTNFAFGSSSCFEVSAGAIFSFPLLFFLHKKNTITSTIVTATIISISRIGTTTAAAGKATGSTEGVAVV